MLTASYDMASICFISVMHDVQVDYLYFSNNTSCVCSIWTKYQATVHVLRTSCTQAHLEMTSAVAQ